MNNIINTFTKTQIEYILDTSPILAISKCRQIGFTYASAYKVARKHINERVINSDTFWISKDEFTAKLFLNDVLLWLRVFNEISNHKQEFKSDIVDMKGVQAMRIKFNNGSCIYAMSSSIDAVVGKRGDFYIDEAAIHKDFKQLISIVMPCTTWGFSLTVISTTRSKLNFFHTFCERIRKGELINAKLMKITLTDILEEGYLDRLNARLTLVGKPIYKNSEDFVDEKRANCPSEDIFLQEYMCTPADAESSQAVKEEELINIMRPQSEIFTKPDKSKRYYAGIDIGRNRDLTVFWINEDVSTNTKPMLITRYVETISQMEFSRQESRLTQLLTEWRPRAAFVDGTNVGAMIAENLEKKFSFCTMIKITATTRPKYITDLISYIKREPVALLIPDSNEIYEDFLSVQRYINKYGQEDFFIPAQREVGHGDRFMATTLALQAFKSKKSMSQFTMTKEEESRKQNYTPQTSRERTRRRGRRENYGY